MDAPETKSLPENAYRALASTETYRPVVSASENVPEATWRSVLWGLFLCAIFTAASAYSGLKVGQVMEAAIPISILAIGLARVYRRRSSLLENVIITGIGGVSGSVVAGAIFTLPALYILKLDPHPWQTIFICLAGGCLGVLFLIPLRRYFVRDMHGRVPLSRGDRHHGGPGHGREGRLAGEAAPGGHRDRGGLRLLRDHLPGLEGDRGFSVHPGHAGARGEGPGGAAIRRHRFHPRPGLRDGAAGLDAAVRGGVLSNFVLVPLIWMIGPHHPQPIYPGPVPISAMSAALIYRWYVRYVGVGAIATAGIFGIIKSMKIVVGSFSIAAKAFRHGEGEGQERTDRDLAIMKILVGVVVSAVAVAIFLGSLGATSIVLLIGLALTLVFSFFFTSVAANAIATTARNPVSGMTMLTIIISSVILLEFGVSGRTGMFFVMAIAGMVCTALSVSGQTITDLKTGYWLGSTPAAQERVKFLGVICSAVVVGLVIVALARTFQFGESVPGDPGRCSYRPRPPS